MRLSSSAPDRAHIATSDPEEVKCWNKHLCVTPGELLRLVKKVGNTAAAVRKDWPMSASNRI
jgi:hypothetical protein